MAIEFVKRLRSNRGFLLFTVPKKVWDLIESKGLANSRFEVKIKRIDGDTELSFASKISSVDIKMTQRGRPYVYHWHAVYIPSSVSRSMGLKKGDMVHIKMIPIGEEHE